MSEIVCDTTQHGKPQIGIFYNSEGGKRAQYDRMDKSPIHKPTFVREWRKFRRMTLDDLSTAACIDKGNLSKMERGLLQYNQETLERLAAALKTDTASLIERDPTDNPPIWTMWDKADREQRRQIEGVVAALIGAKAD